MPVQFDQITFDDRYTFDYIKRDQRTLVVTIGESWTWGHGLSKNKYVFPVVQETDEQRNERLSKVFGNLVAEKSNADFLNIASPGQSNGWICHYFDQFIKNYRMFKNYERIIVVITFSEVGREFLGEYDNEHDFYKHLAGVRSINHFFQKSSERICRKIEMIQEKIQRNNYPIHVVKGIGFVDNNYPEQFENNSYKKFIDFEKSWFEFILDEQKIDYSLKGLYAIQSQTIEKMDWLIEYNHHTFVEGKKVKRDNPTLPLETFKTQRNEWMTAIERFNEIIGKSSMNQNLVGSTHPNERGHELWANKIFYNIQILI